MNAADRIRQLLDQRGCLLLDGSMGQELQRRGVPDDEQFWTALVLESSPDQVLDLHAEYVAAGADVITTCTYAINWNRFERAGQGDRFEALNRRACELARQAASRGERPVLVAGSLPPLRESYRPEQVPDLDRMLEEYARQTRILADYVDLFLCETLTSAVESRAAATAALEVAGERPVWVSWTLMDDGSGRLRSGERLAAAAAQLCDLDVHGLLVNCSTPEALTAGLDELVACDVAVHGVYANGFLPIGLPEAPRSSGFGAREDLDPDAYAHWARRWIAGGANLLGGCCEVGPPHIARLRRLIDRTA